jgi:hypothetical protein
MAVIRKLQLMRPFMVEVAAYGGLLVAAYGVPHIRAGAVSALYIAPSRRAVK